MDRRELIGQRRVESLLVHFEFRHSNFENRERVESGELGGQRRAKGRGWRAGSSDRVRWLFDLVDLSNRGRRNGFPGKILPDFF